MTKLHTRARKNKPSVEKQKRFCRGFPLLKFGKQNNAFKYKKGRCKRGISSAISAVIVYRWPWASSGSRVWGVVSSVATPWYSYELVLPIAVFSRPPGLLSKLGQNGRKKGLKFGRELHVDRTYRSTYMMHTEQVRSWKSKTLKKKRQQQQNVLDKNKKFKSTFTHAGNPPAHLLDSHAHRALETPHTQQTEHPQNV